ncbi:hypothetical protein [Thermoactinospora rubra]|uniref:hypothetical protein n=1 Tax=Thermoactinospora rubra TaxID=1088767 RepID=UPI000A100AC6|nr:hypothetical protein [Thermoactinospora rubra]
MTATLLADVDLEPSYGQCFSTERPPLPLGCAVCGHAPYEHGETGCGAVAPHKYRTPDAEQVAARWDLLSAAGIWGRRMPAVDWFPPVMCAPAFENAADEQPVEEPVSGDVVELPMAPGGEEPRWQLYPDGWDAGFEPDLDDDDDEVAESLAIPRLPDLIAARPTAREPVTARARSTSPLAAACRTASAWLNLRTELRPHRPPRRQARAVSRRAVCRRPLSSRSTADMGWTASRPATRRERPPCGAGRPPDGSTPRLRDPVGVA